MTRSFATLCICVALCSLASAEPPTSDDQWLKELRGSGTYREGMRYVEQRVEAAYDTGAVSGASHWEDVHDYYTRLARAKGCQKGSAPTIGPVKACPRVSGPPPKLVDEHYRDGVRRVEALADESVHPELVRRLMVVLFDYGYMQGMKHGLRVHNDEIRLMQTYYRACMERARGAEAEPTCAEASKTWTGKLLQNVNQRIESHGIPIGKKP